MILHALNDYYKRSGDLAPPGWERKRIPYVIEIDRQGHFVQLTSLRSGTRQTDVTPLLVPKAEVRSGVRAYEKPNLLWDHLGFVLGHPRSSSETDVELADRQFEHFRQRLKALQELLPGSGAMLALSNFYESGQFRLVARDSHWSECIAMPGCNLTFRFAGEIDLLAHEAEIRKYVDDPASQQQASDRGGICLVSGEFDEIQRLHFPISGVAAKPAPLSAINNGSYPAFASYGKHQGDNFPVGARAAFAYSTSLNHLLGSSSTQRLRLGDATLVFWAQRVDPIEDELTELLGGGEDDPDAHVRQVRGLYEAVHTGGFSQARGDNGFHVLGLAPNAARIAVRFWHAAPLRDVAERIVSWFDDLCLVGGPYDHPYPQLKALLRAVVLQRKDDNIPPNLAGDVLRAIFTGGPFPARWLNLAVQRCRAEREVSHLRACVIKACINRSLRLTRSTTEEEYATMLDPNNNTPAYRLGRLFAVLEKIQEESAGGSLNKTIRDRYYGAASSTPASVVPLLLKLKNHHLAKLDERGQRMLYRAFQDRRPDDYIGEVLQSVESIPAHLSLPEQGRFALGYYHQRQAFFTKAAGAAGTDTTTNANNEGSH